MVNCAGRGGAKSARALLRFCIKRGKYILEGGEAKFARGVVGVDKKSIFARLDFCPTALAKCLSAREILPTFIVRHEEQAEYSVFFRPLLVKELRT